MKLRVTAVLAAVIAAGAAASSGASAGSAGDGRVPTRVGVRGAEFSLVLSRIRVAPGPAVVQFHNAGEDPHDLRMRRLDATHELGTGEVESGGVESFEVAWLRRRSRYRLWCSLPGHEEAGMRATLRVKRRR